MLGVDDFAQSDAIAHKSECRHECRRANRRRKYDFKQRVGAAPTGAPSLRGAYVSPSCVANRLHGRFTGLAVLYGRNGPRKLSFHGGTSNTTASAELRLGAVASIDSPVVSAASQRGNRDAEPETARLYTYCTRALPVAWSTVIVRFRSAEVTLTV